MENAYTCDRYNRRGPPPANPVADVSSKNQPQDRAELLEEDVDSNHSASLVGKEHIKDLPKISFDVFAKKNYLQPTVN